MTTNLTPILNHLTELEAKATKAKAAVEAAGIARLEMRKKPNHLKTCSESVNAEDEYDLAVELSTDLDSELKSALRNLALPILNVVKAAEKANQALEMEYSNTVYLANIGILGEALSDLAAKAKELGI